MKSSEVFGVEVILLCISMNGHKVSADRSLQPYGPQMCKALCQRMKCSGSIFDEVMLECNLHFPTETREALELNSPEPSQRGTMDVDDELRNLITKLNNMESSEEETRKHKLFNSEFFVKTERNLYYFDEFLSKHKINLKQLPKFKFLEDVFLCYEGRSLWAILKGKLYVADFKKYTVHFKKDLFIKVLKNVRVVNLELDIKNNILATTSFTAMDVLLHVFWNRSHPRTLVEKSVFCVILTLDKQKRLVFYSNEEQYVASFNYKGQHNRKYRKLQIVNLQKIEVEGRIITYYVCKENRILAYQFDIISKKKTKKMDVHIHCYGFTYLIRVENKIAFSQRRGFIVKGGGSSKSLLRTETVHKMFLLR